MRLMHGRKPGRCAKAHDHAEHPPGGLRALSVVLHLVVEWYDNSDAGAILFAREKFPGLSRLYR